MSVQNFCDNVTQELRAMKEIGMRVPQKAFTMAQDTTIMAEYENMSTTECSDLIIQLAGIK